MGVRNSKNTINRLWDDQGMKVEEVAQIKRVAEDYYKGLLGTNNHVFDDSMIDRIGGLVTTRLTDVQARDMERDPSEVEIRSTLFAINNNKAPRPDGFSAGFFKDAWNVVGSDVIAAIKSFFSTKRLLSEMNSTIITLVPHKENPSSMGDFRPIAC